MRFRRAIVLYLPCFGQMSYGPLLSCCLFFYDILGFGVWAFGSIQRFFVLYG